jgi:hypothetical protein
MPLLLGVFMPQVCTLLAIVAATLLAVHSCWITAIVTL